MCLCLSILIGAGWPSLPVCPHLYVCVWLLLCGNMFLEVLLACEAYVLCVGRSMGSQILQMYFMPLLRWQSGKRVSVTAGTQCQLAQPLRRQKLPHRCLASFPPW